MLRLAVRQLLTRRLGAGLTIAALATAAVGAIAIAAVARQSRAQLEGGVERAWRTPVDLLVRPDGSATALERSEGLVRPNYLSGVIGGITDAQLADIRRIPGVEVAAPVSIVGFGEWPGAVSLNERRLLSAKPVTRLRLRTTARADAGLSRFPTLLRPDYLAVAPKGTVVDRFAVGPPGEVLVAGSRRIRCSGPDASSSPSRPRCEGARLHVFNPQGEERYPGNLNARWTLPLRLPLLIAGVDPRAEARLTGLDRCVTAGRYLRAGPLRTHTVVHPELVVNSISGDWDRISVTDLPLLASDRSFLGEQVTTIAERREGGQWRTVTRSTQSLEDIYRRTLGRIGRRLLANGVVVAAGEVGYRTLGPAHLEAQGRPQFFSAFNNPVFGEEGTGRRYAPAEAHDSWLRRVTGRELALGQVASSRFVRTGTYDPGCLPGFDPLAGARLDVAAPPSVRLRSGAALMPTRSPAGYVTPPPLMLTTLQGARYFADPSLYSPATGDAYISVVRVRVRDVQQPTDASRARLGAVAAQIHDRTGLRVDVVKGASTRTVLVDLPAGRFGRPPLTVREEWSVKGVAVRFGKAIDAQSVALLVIAMLTALLLTAQTTQVSVRRRRAEFAVLRAMGWGRRHLVRLVVTEALVAGAVAGAIAAACGCVVLAALGRGQPGVALLAVPALAVLAAVAATAPAFEAGYGSVLGRLARRAGPRLSSAPRNVPTAGLAALRHGWGTDAIVAIVAVAIGAGSVGAVVLVAASFQGSLDATVLGRHLRAQAGPAHVAAACLSALLGAAVGCQVVLLSYLERRKQLAALRAMGWPTAALRRFVGTQGAALAAAAGALAAAGVAGVGAVLGAEPGPSAIGAGATLGVAVLVGLAIAAVPAALIRSSLVEALADA